jgi:dephospho-CoA kinase
VLNVGLTGGIGSGKSEVSRRLVARGATLIDADAIAHEVVAVGTPGLALVAAEFGPEVLAPDGSLDRERVASIVFADPAALSRLNAIVHPLVGERVAELSEHARRRDPDGIVVHDVPLIVEAGVAERYDVVVVVDASLEVQLDRLTRLRGMTEEAARARIEAQASREQRRAIADFVIVNDDGLDALEAQLSEVWTALLRWSGAEV